MYVLKTSSSTLPWQFTTPFSACTSAMSAWTESALERLAPEPLLCTAGVGLALFTVGFCTGTASSLFTAVVLRAHRFLVLDCWLLHRRHSWLWKNHCRLRGLRLATDRRGRVRPGKGRSWALRRRARLCGVGLLQCRLLHGCRCLSRHLGCRRCRRRQWTGSFSACISSRNA